MVSACNSVVPNVQLFVNGQQSFSAIIERIRTARSSIYIKMYVWRGDCIGRRLAQEVLRAADRGVRVTIEKDPQGALYEHVEFSRQSLFHPHLDVMDRMRCAGLSLSLVGSTRSHAQLEINGHLLRMMQHHPNIELIVERGYPDHSKFYEIDGRTLILGDSNVGDEFYRTWRTCMVLLEGTDVVRRFHDRRDDRVPFDSNRRVDFLFNRKGRNEIRQQMIGNIRAARQRFVAQMAFWGDALIQQAVVDAARRLGRIDIIIPAEANVQDDLNKKAMRDVIVATHGAARVHLYPGMVHSKVFFSDGRRALLGSANASPGSVAMGDTNVHINGTDTGFGTALRHQLEIDMSASRLVKDPRELMFNPLLAGLEYYCQRLSHS